MKWLKRGFWLAAWAVWLWLGFGLYRELPRDLGPVVCRLPLGPDELIVRFDGALQAITTIIFNQASEQWSFKRWNARDGKPIEEFGRVAFGRGPPAFSTSREFLHVKVAPTKDKPTMTLGTPTGDSGGSYLLDLVTGNWIELRGGARGPIFHAERPWALFCSPPGSGKNEFLVWAFDLRSGQPIFEWKSSTREFEYGAEPFFIGEDRVGIPRSPRRNSPNSLSESALEVWSIPPGERPLSIIEGVSIGSDGYPDRGACLSSLRPRRIAWHRTADLGYSTKVFDADAQSMVFTEPTTNPPDRRGGFRGGWRGPAVSEDGRFVMNVLTGRIHEVETGRLHWWPRANEFISWIDSGSRFEVYEEWDVGIGSWSTKFATFAVRRFHDFSVERRTYWPTLEFEREGLSFLDGAVYELPKSANWPLLALCQAILALPLVLLWAVLRWRKRARVRASSDAFEPTKE